MGVAAAAVSAAVLGITAKTVKNTVALENFNKQTGLSINLLQKWQRAGALSDTELSVEKIAENIKGLQKNLTDLQFGGGNTQGFRLLGIDVTGKDAFQVLEEVRGAIKGLSNVQATNLLGKIGLSPNFINVLRTSREEFNKLGSGWFLNAGERKKVVQVGTALAKMKLEMIELRDKAVARFAPDILNLITNIQNLTDNIFRFASELGSSENGLMAFKAVMVGLAVVFAPTVSIVVALILLIEDLYVLFKGGDSIIGKWATDIFDGFLKAEKAATSWWESTGKGDKVGKALDTAFDATAKYGKAIVDDMLQITTGGKLPTAKSLVNADSRAALLRSNAENSGSNTVTNNFEINSTAEPESVATEVEKVQERVFNNTFGNLQGGSL